MEHKLDVWRECKGWVVHRIESPCETRIRRKGVVDWIKLYNCTLLYDLQTRRPI